MRPASSWAEDGAGREVVIVNPIGPAQIRIARERVTEALEEARLQREVRRAREQNAAPPTRRPTGGSLAHLLARLAGPLLRLRRDDPCPTC